MTPRTKAGATWDATVRSAVLDPAVAKMIGADGRQVLLSLVNPDANRDAVRAIEDEMLDKVLSGVSRWRVENEPIRDEAERRTGSRFVTAPMKDGIRYDSKGEPIPAVTECNVEGFHDHRFDGPHRLAAPAVTETDHAPGCDVFRIAESWEPYGVPRHCDCGFAVRDAKRRGVYNWTPPAPAVTETAPCWMRRWGDD